MTWPMLEPALTVAKALEPLSDQKLPHEVLRLEDGISTIIMDIGGKDYALTMMEVPKQRDRSYAQTIQ